MARAVSKVVEPQKRDAVVKRLASVQDKSAVKAVHSVLKKTKLAINVTQTIIPEGPASGITVIKLTDFVKCMVANKQLHRLYGGLGLDELPGVLRVFWSRLRRIRPTLSVFMFFDHGFARPESTLPMYIHGDEGRGRIYSKGHMSRCS